MNGHEINKTPKCDGFFNLLRGGANRKAHNIAVDYTHKKLYTGQAGKNGPVRILTKDEIALLNINP